METLEDIEKIEVEVKEELVEESVETGIQFGGLDIDRKKVYIKG